MVVFSQEIPSIIAVIGFLLLTGYVMLHLIVMRHFLIGSPLVTSLAAWETHHDSLPTKQLAAFSSWRSSDNNVSIEEQRATANSPVVNDELAISEPEVNHYEPLLFT